MGKVQLTLVRTWGDENEEDDNRIFKNPWDVVVGNNELIYICDFGRQITGDNKYFDGYKISCDNYF